MPLRPWDKLPENLKNNSIKKYYAALAEKKQSFLIKRCFDFVMSLVLFIILTPVFLLIAIIIKADSKGPVFFKQIRITQYGRPFYILKFRTMIENADQMGTHVTTNHDQRITKAGKLLRKCRLDEIPQLINILKGEMSFVGTRPEVLNYVEKYTPEMMATLLMPAGVTSLASITYKDEEKLLSNAENANRVYLEVILPEKMKYNLEYVLNFNFKNDLKIMFKTIFAVLPH